ncbi:MAG: glycosyltransferase family 2 protein [Candidatus Jordarchaeaceae archaeon]
MVFFSKEMISHIIEHHNKTTHFYPNWKDDDLNIVIPMAGWGSRFTKVGYKDPKPLIKIFDKPMIELVVKSLHIQANIIFIVRKEHRNQYNLDYFLKYITHNNCHIIETEKVTEGAACTVLLAENLINNDKQLLIVNSDQYIKWDSINFMYKNISNPLLDGSILTFEDNSNKWSYVRLNDQNLVEEVREKEVISNKATVGIYYWKKGKDFVKYAKQMIEKNIRVNNEFYVAPVYNEAIQDGKHIFTYDVEEMWGLGTPEDLEYFLKHKSYEDL